MFINFIFRKVLLQRNIPCLSKFILPLSFFHNSCIPYRRYFSFYVARLMILFPIHPGLSLLEPSFNPHIVHLGVRSYVWIFCDSPHQCFKVSIRLLPNISTRRICSPLQACSFLQESCSEMNINGSERPIRRHPLDVITEAAHHKKYLKLCMFLYSTDNELQELGTEQICQAIRALLAFHLYSKKDGEMATFFLTRIRYRSVLVKNVN